MLPCLCVCIRAHTCVCMPLLLPGHRGPPVGKQSPDLQPRCLQARPPHSLLCCGHLQASVTFSPSVAAPPPPVALASLMCSFLPLPQSRTSVGTPETSFAITPMAVSSLRAPCQRPVPRDHHFLSHSHQMHPKPLLPGTARRWPSCPVSLTSHTLARFLRTPLSLAPYSLLAISGHPGPRDIGTHGPPSP